MASKAAIKYVGCALNMPSAMSSVRKAYSAADPRPGNVSISQAMETVPDSKAMHTNRSPVRDVIDLR